MLTEKKLAAPKNLRVHIETVVDTDLENVNQFKISFDSSAAQQYVGMVECTMDPAEDWILRTLYEREKTFTGSKKPLYYSVRRGLEDHYFRFKIKCKNNESQIESAYSDWSDWKKGKPEKAKFAWWRK